MGFLANERKIFVGIDKDSGQFAEKNNGTITLHGGIEGKLIKIYEQHSELKDGTKLHKLVVDLKDDKDTYAVQFGFDTQAARNIINSLLTVEQPNGWLLLRAYQKDNYNKLYLEYNKAKTNWRFTPDQFPKIEKVQLKSGKEVEDDTAVKEFWYNAFLELLSKFQAPVPHEDNFESDNELNGEDKNVPF
jgi:hypothetical protein